MHGNKKITKEDRLVLLTVHNHLKEMSGNIKDMNDLYLTDIRNLESAIHILHNMFGFEPDVDDEGNSKS